MFNKHFELIVGDSDAVCHMRCFSPKVNYEN
jgi:hypothetical protein